MSLSEQQKQIQEAAAYGLPQTPTAPGGFTHEQIEGMRRFIQQYDAQNAAITREFDLNKPPTPPYRYQEFPRLLYRGGKTITAQDARGQDLLLQQGWSVAPPLGTKVDIEVKLDPQSAAEAQAIDLQLRPKPQVQKKSPSNWTIE